MADGKALRHIVGAGIERQADHFTSMQRNRERFLHGAKRCLFPLQCFQLVVAAMFDLRVWDEASCAVGVEKESLPTDCKRAIPAGAAIDDDDTVVVRRGSQAQPRRL